MRVLVLRLLYFYQLLTTPQKKTMPCVKNALSWLIFWGNKTHTDTLKICKAVSKKHEIVNEVISSNAELKLKLNHPL